MGKGISEIINERDLRLIGNELRISMIIADILTSIKRSLDEKANILDESYLIISKIRAEMIENFSDDWTLEKISRLSGYSASRFSALYKKYFKVAPISELIKTRVTRAESLLLYSGYSISEIAYLCGFSSQQYFSRIYKAIKGVSPYKTYSSKKL